MSEWFSKWGSWLLAGLAVVGGCALAIWALARGRSSDASKVMQDTIEQWHATDVAAKQAELQRLLRNADGAADQITKLETALDAKRASLKQGYVDKGLTNEEIAAKLRRIRL